ncbi:glycosyltransferase [Halovenus marina]|uniref:glycosyltransferase n=1 Tax=Halovenus marina TaxID=3396621 RepID=UPI003F547732
MGQQSVTASIVVPALDEAAYLPRTLESIRAMETDISHEVLVVDGGSVDGTPEIAPEYGVRVLDQPSGGIGAGRDLGAQRAVGDWLVFVDADTRVTGQYLSAMLEYVRERNLDAASSRCRVIDVYRGKAKQVIVNRVFPHLRKPILPGFNFVVDADVYEQTGGFPDVPNEDTAYSRQLGTECQTGYHPDVLVETSGRRFGESGLTGALYHYLRLDVGRFLSQSGQGN